jgi:hypothetical protein
VTLKNTYNDPSENINMSATFFLVLSFNFLNSHTGKSIMKKSSKMLKPAAEYTIACRFKHFAGAIVQMVDMGTHCNRMQKKYIIPCTPRKAIVPQTTLRKILSIKMRRYRQSMEILART